MLEVRKYAAKQEIAEEEALKKGMEEKSREFTEKGSELYAKGDFQVFFPATQALEKFLKKSA